MKKTYELTSEKIAALSTEQLFLLGYTQAFGGVYLDEPTFNAVRAEMRRRADLALEAAGAVEVEER